MFEYRKCSEIHTLVPFTEVVSFFGAINSPQVLMNLITGLAVELEEVRIKPLINFPVIGKNLQKHINLPKTFW